MEKEGGDLSSERFLYSSCLALPGQQFQTLKQAPTTAVGTAPDIGAIIPTIITATASGIGTIRIEGTIARWCGGTITDAAGATNGRNKVHGRGGTSHTSAIL